MIKGPARFLLLIAGLFCFSEIIGQENNCLTRLDDAEVLFNSGIFEDIPLLLEECLDTYSEENRKKASRLIVLAYYMNDDIPSAEEAMRDLFYTFPEYKLPVGATADYQFVYESFRVRRLMDIGIMAGPLFTPGNLLEPYGPFQERFTYSFNLPGISVGALINIPIYNFISISTEPSISQYSFQLTYDNLIGDIYKIEQSERNTILNLPLHIRFTLLKTRFQPYLKIGGELDYLIAANTESKLERFDPATGKIINPQESIKRDHIEYRARTSYYVGGGLGLKMNFNKFYLFAEADYYHPLTDMLASGENRFEQSNLWSEAWVDSDFRIIHASMRFGIARSIYSIKKIR